MSMPRIVSFLLVLLATGCDIGGPDLTLYVSHDRNLSEPIIEVFTAKTGIEVKAVYDTEANKTTGLVNRLVAERERPVADIFWNNEIGRTVQLAERGLLAPYRPAADWPDRYRGEQDRWAGFAGRARVFVVNNDLVAQGDAPEGVMDLIDPRWRGQVAIANPHFGTTGTHFTALYLHWGEAWFRQWLRALQANEVALLPGNAQVRDQVASGRYRVGLTDTDDVNAALVDGKPVRLVVPDQAVDGIGVFIIPNTISMVAGASQPEHARAFIDYLLSARVEDRLAQGRAAQIPLGSDVPGPDIFPPLEDVNRMEVNYARLGAAFDTMLEIFREEWDR